MTRGAAPSRRASASTGDSTRAGSRRRACRWPRGASPSLISGRRRARRAHALISKEFDRELALAAPDDVAGHQRDSRRSALHADAASVNAPSPPPTTRTSRPSTSAARTSARRRGRRGRLSSRPGRRQHSASPPASTRAPKARANAPRGPPASRGSFRISASRGGADRRRGRGVAGRDDFEAGHLVGQDARGRTGPLGL